MRMRNTLLSTRQKNLRSTILRNPIIALPRQKDWKAFKSLTNKTLRNFRTTFV